MRARSDEIHLRSIRASPPSAMRAQVTSPKRLPRGRRGRNGSLAHLQVDPAPGAPRPVKSLGVVFFRSGGDGGQGGTAADALRGADTTRASPVRRHVAQQPRVIGARVAVRARAGVGQGVDTPTPRLLRRRLRQFSARHPLPIDRRQRHHPAAAPGRGPAHRLRRAARDRARALGTAGPAHRFQLPSPVHRFRPAHRFRRTALVRTASMPEPRRISANDIRSSSTSSASSRSTPSERIQVTSSSSWSSE